MYRVALLHLSSQLRRQICALSSVNLRSHRPESQLSIIHAAEQTKLNWTSCDRHLSFLSQRKGSWAQVLPALLCGSNNTENPPVKKEKKLTYHFLNICQRSRFLPPVSWQGRVRLTWRGFKPIEWLLLQPDRARTRQLWLRRIEAS